MNTVVKETLNNFHKNGKSKKLYFPPRLAPPLLLNIMLTLPATFSESGSVRCMVARLVVSVVGWQPGAGVVTRGEETTAGHHCHLAAR